MRGAAASSSPAHQLVEEVTSGTSTRIDWSTQTWSADERRRYQQFADGMRWLRLERDEDVFDDVTLLTVYHYWRIAPHLFSYAAKDTERRVPLNVDVDRIRQAVVQDNDQTARDMLRDLFCRLLPLLARAAVS